MDSVLPSDKSFKNPRTAEALSVCPSDMAMPRQVPSSFSWRPGRKVVPLESPGKAVYLKEGFPLQRDCPPLLWHLRTPKVPVEKDETS